MKSTAGLLPAFRVLCRKLAAKRNAPISEKERAAAWDYVLQMNSASRFPVLNTPNNTGSGKQSIGVTAYQGPSKLPGSFTKQRGTEIDVYG